MRLSKCSFVIILYLICLINSGTEIFAMKTGFSTASLIEEEKRTFVTNVNISLLGEEPTKKAIECFDINENGMVAIGQNNSNSKILCVYSQDGIFQYGYTFNCSGKFGVEWNKNNINIYFARSDILITLNQTGEILDVLKVQNTIENNSYRNDFIYSTKRIVGDTEYLIRNNMGCLNIFSSSYSQLVVTKSLGEEVIIYDVNSEQIAKTLNICILGAIVFLISVIIIIWQFIKYLPKIPHGS